MPNKAYVMLKKGNSLGIAQVASSICAECSRKYLLKLRG